MFHSDGLLSVDYPISVQRKKIEISVNMKAKRAIIFLTLEASTKVLIKLLKVIVSYLLNTVIPAFALMKSNRLTFQPVHLAHLCAPSDYQCKRKFPPT